MVVILVDSIDYSPIQNVVSSIGLFMDEVVS